MSIQYNGQNIKEMYYNGQKISEAYYNGEKVFSSENVLFEGDWNTSNNNWWLSLPETYPAGSIIVWEPSVSAPYLEKGYGLNQNVTYTGGAQTRIISSHDFKDLYCLYAAGMAPLPEYNFHVKIIGA